MLKAAPRAENAKLGDGVRGPFGRQPVPQQGNLEAATTNLQLTQKILADLHCCCPRMTEYTGSLSLPAHEDLATLAEKQEAVFRRGERIAAGPNHS